MEEKAVYNKKLSDESIEDMKRAYEIGNEIESLEAQVKGLKSDIKGLSRQKAMLEKRYFKAIGVIPEGLNLFTSISILKSGEENTQFKD